MASRTLERTISEETTCSICCDQFKDPKMLPCQHTFCLKCLENVAKLNDPNTVDCPLCRKVYKVPTRGGVGRFKSNLLMKTLLEAKGSSPSNSSITEDEKFERKSQSQGFKNIVATPSAPPLDSIPNYHHTTTSSQVNSQQVRYNDAGIAGQRNTNEVQIIIDPRLLLNDNTSRGSQHSSSSKGCRSKCMIYLILLLLVIVGGIIIIVLNYAGEVPNLENQGQIRNLMARKTYGENANIITDISLKDFCLQEAKDPNMANIKRKFC